MALPRVPNLLELWDRIAAGDVSAISSLPAPIIEQVLSHFRQAAQAVEAATAVPPTPIELAIRFPRWRWLDARHIHALGVEVAATIDEAGALMVCMPPQHCKSTTCSVWACFWALARNPECKILLISYEKTVARRWGVRVRSLIEMYGADFGLYLDPKKTAGDDWELTTGGGMVCVGVGGPVSGRTVDLLIADDLIKDQEAARSEVQRETVWQWWDETASQRIQQGTAVIIIGTRWHEDDILGRILQHSQAGDGLRVDTVVFRAKAEADDPLGRAPGVGLWLEKNSQQFYDDKEATISPYAWSSGWQQHPSPPSGNTVDPLWWRYYLPRELPEHLDQEAQSWDLALDAEKKADSYHCGMLGARKGAMIFLRDAYHEHSRIAASPLNTTEKSVVTTMRNWTQIYPGARYKLVERALAGPMLIQSLQHEMSGLLPWPPKGSRKPSKQAMLEACIPDIRPGNVLLPLNPDGSKPRWVVEFIAELQQFPNAPHDDYVDAFTQLMAFLLPGVRRAISSDQSAAKARRPVETPLDAHTQALHQIMKRMTDKKRKTLMRDMKEDARRAAAGLHKLLRFRSGQLGQKGNLRTGRGMW